MAGKTFADDEQPLLNEQKPKSSLTRVAVLAVACYDGALAWSTGFAAVTVAASTVAFL